MRFVTAGYPPTSSVSSGLPLQLRRATPFVTESWVVRAYTPFETQTLSPAAAASIAAWMLVAAPTQLVNL
jgi:hypothetical protein